MKRMILIALGLPLIAASPPPPALPAPYTAAESEQVRCTAMLAIVANDQARGAPGWEGLPWLPARGAHFAGLIGKALMESTGRTRDQIKADMISAVATLQTASAKRPIRPSDVQPCIALMNQLDPPAAPPKLPRCAAMVGLALNDARAREGNSLTAQKLSNIASILDSKARDMLRAQGKTGVESDGIMGLEREKLTGEAKRNRSVVNAPAFDIEACFALAAEK